MRSIPLPWRRAAVVNHHRSLGQSWPVDTRHRGSRLSTRDSRDAARRLGGAVTHPVELVEVVEGDSVSVQGGAGIVQRRLAALDLVTGHAARIGRGLRDETAFLAA